MKLENVTKRYGDAFALDRLTVDLKEGEITAVLGESGAGKTTLLNVLAGLTSYEGTVAGREGKKPVQRANCSYLLQENALLPHLTAEENLRFVLPKGEWDKIGAMLERVGLKGKERSRPRQLSGGEQRRVAIARAFLFPHDLLLMDEPFSSLDLSLKASLIQLVFEMWREWGETVVFVTHDVHEAAMLSSRAIILKKGKIASDFIISSPIPRDFRFPLKEESALTGALMDV